MDLILSKHGCYWLFQDEYAMLKMIYEIALKLYNNLYNVCIKNHLVPMDHYISSGTNMQVRKLKKWHWQRNYDVLYHFRVNGIYQL